MKVTVRKIAEMAGVSRGTVDRVLNGRPGVKPEVMEKVLKIIEEMDYKPNRAGKALAYCGKEMKLGIVMPPEEVSFFKEVKKGIEAACRELKDYGVTAECRHVSNSAPDECITAMRELTGSGASGLAISLMDDPGIAAEIDRSMASGIPVVTFNSDVGSSKRICFIGQDLYKSGEVAAGLMSKLLPGVGKVLAVIGSRGFNAHRSRLEGFESRLKELGSGVMTAGLIEGHDRYADTYAGLKEMLEKHGDIAGIFMAAGDINACMDAVRNSGYGRRIAIVCNDLLDDTAKYLKSGLVDFVICQNPFLQGYLPVKLLYDYVLENKRPESEFVYTGLDIKVAENI